MKKLFLILCLSCVAWAHVYVLDGGTGDGSAWNNALDDLPATLTRGDSIFVGDGEYAAYTFNDAEDGSKYIIIKKATPTMHGTATGWNNSYGDGQAVFGQLVFSTGYHIVDGTVGGYPVWDSGYGIKITYAPAGYGVTASNQKNLFFSHVEGKGAGRDSPLNQRFVYMSGCDTVSFTYCMIYDAYKGEVQLVNTNNITISRCRIGPNGIADENDDIHGFGVDIKNNRNAVISYNSFVDIAETGFISVVTDDATDSMINLSVYGNVFYRTLLLDNTSNSMLIAANATCVWKNFKFYNNTIAQLLMSNAGFYITGDDGSGNEVKNNIWYACTTQTLTFPEWIADDYNYYGNNVTSAGAPVTVTETHSQSKSGSPFVDILNFDFRLSASTDAGESLSSPYNVDIAGIVRGSSGVWDRGAYEYDNRQINIIIRR
jgi:hypothetical protein